jgi:hypothetical protein
MIFFGPAFRGADFLGVGSSASQLDVRMESSSARKNTSGSHERCIPIVALEAAHAPSSSASAIA